MSLDFLEVPGSHTRKYSFKSDVWQTFSSGILLPAGHCPGPQRPTGPRSWPPVGPTFEDSTLLGQFLAYFRSGGQSAAILPVFARNVQNRLFLQVTPRARARGSGGNATVPPER